MKTLQDRITWAFKEAKKRDPNLTKTTLWKACKISSGAVSLWFNGSTQTIEGEHSKTVAELLGVDRDWLAFGKGQPHPRGGVLVAQEPPPHSYLPENPPDDQEMFVRMLALQAGLLALIRTTAYNPNIPPVLQQELQRAKDMLSANPIREEALAAFDVQAESILQSADIHHSRRS